MLTIYAMEGALLICLCICLQKTMAPLVWTPVDEKDGARKRALTDDLGKQMHGGLSSVSVIT